MCVCVCVCVCVCLSVSVCVIVYVCVFMSMRIRMFYRFMRTYIESLILCWYVLVRIDRISQICQMHTKTNTLTFHILDVLIKDTYKPNRISKY